jgi:hypothetical protein
MKKPSAHLFKLIKTLTKSEKRAFLKRASSGGSDKKYLDIFNAIDAQETYDEEAIKRKFKNEPWTSRFNAAKDYVYKTLLNELSTYNQKHEPQYELADLLLNIRVLQSKGFYERCQKLIEKGKGLANSLDDHLNMLALINLEGQNHPGGINPHRAKELRQIQVKLLNLLDNKQQYEALYKRSYAVFSRSGNEGFTMHDAKDYDCIMTDPLMANIDLALTFSAKRQFINIHYFNAFGRKQLDKTHYWICLALDLFKENPEIIQQQPIQYATALLNLSNSFNRRKEYEAALDAIDELRSFYPKKILKSHERLTYLIDYAGLHHEVMIHTNSGNFDVLPDKLTLLSKTFAKHDQEISKNIHIRHIALLANAYFGLGNWKKSKALVNRLLDHIDAKTRIDLQKQIRVLLLQIYYEQGKMDLLESAIRSTVRGFQRGDNMTTLDQAVLNLTQHLVLKGFNDKTAIMRKLVEIKCINQSEHFNANYEQNICWLESKILNKSYQEIVQSKNNTLNT